MNTSFTVHSNSKVVYTIKKELDYSCRHFEMVQGKIKTSHLKLKSPGFGTAQSRCWSSVSQLLSELHQQSVSQEIKAKAISACGLDNVDIIDYSKQAGRINTYLSQSHIMREINRKKPVCICFKQEGTNSVRAMVIYGYSLTPDNFVIHAADPWDGDLQINYASFNSLYKANWTTSYLSA